MRLVRSSLFSLLAGAFISGFTVMAPVRAAGDNVSVSGPITGLVYDPLSRTVGPIVGLPGSAYLGPSLIDNVQSFAAAPNGQAILLVRERRLAVASEIAAPVHAVEPEGLPASVVSAAWSTDGKAAVAWSNDTIYALRYEDGRLALTEAVVVAQSPEKIVRALITSDSHVLVSTAREGSGALYLVSDRQARLLMQTQSPANLAAVGDRAYAADRAGQRILQIASGDGTAETLLEAGHGLVDPVAIDVSADGSTIYVANRTGRTLQMYNVERRTLTRDTTLDFEPCSLERIPKSPYLLLNPCTESGPLSIVEDTVRPVVYFVPLTRRQ